MYTGQQGKHSICMYSVMLDQPESSLAPQIQDPLITVQQSPNHFVPGTGFVEDNISTDQGQGMVSGWFTHITFITQFISNTTLHWPDRRCRWLSGGESACQCKRPRFNSRVGKIPWRRKWHPTPVFLPGKSHGQRSLAGYSPWGRKKPDRTQQHTQWSTAQRLATPA